MTGIKFMDELAAPRRSTILPSMLSGPTFSESVDDVALADFVVSMSIDLPQWMLHAVAVKDLQNMIDAMKEHHRHAEEEVEKDVPALFREFAEAEPDLKEELLVSGLNHIIGYRDQLFMLVLASTQVDKSEQPRPCSLGLVRHQDVLVEFVLRICRERFC